MIIDQFLAQSKTCLLKISSEFFICNLAYGVFLSDPIGSFNWGYDKANGISYGYGQKSRPFSSFFGIPDWIWEARCLSFIASGDRKK